MIQKNSEFGCWLCGETRLRIEYLRYGAHLASETRMWDLILNPFSIGLPGNPHAAQVTMERALHSESIEELQAKARNDIKAQQRLWQSGNSTTI
jgi:hypothetical protein